MGAVIVAVMLISVIHHYQLRAEVNAYIAELKAKGEPLDLTQILLPSGSPAQNDTQSFLEAASTFEANNGLLRNNYPPMMRMLAPGKAIIGWDQPEIRGARWSNSWNNVRETLAPDSDVLDEVQQITNRPELNFDIGYTNNSYRFVSLLGDVALWLSASAVYNLHNGNTASAVAETHSVFVTANAIQHGRIYNAETFRMHAVDVAPAMTWEILQSTNVTDGELAELQRDWTNLEFIQSERDGLLVERAITLGLWQKSTWKRSVYEDILKNDYDLWDPDNSGEHFWLKTKIKIEFFIWQYWWSYSDMIRALKGYDIIIDTTKSIQTNNIFYDALNYQKFLVYQLSEYKNTPFYDDLGFHSIFSGPVEELNFTTESVMREEAAKQLAVAAIALKRYQIKNGQYPSDLNLLVPEFVSGVPLDPVDGKPLHYRLNADGTFLLYSIGPNGRDDGGKDSEWWHWPDPMALDWVWPKPATADEVQKYYANFGEQN